MIGGGRGRSAGRPDPPRSRSLPRVSRARPAARSEAGPMSTSASAAALVADPGSPADGCRYGVKVERSSPARGACARAGWGAEARSPGTPVRRPDRFAIEPHRAPDWPAAAAGQRTGALQSLSSGASAADRPAQSDSPSSAAGTAPSVETASAAETADLPPVGMVRDAPLTEGLQFTERAMSLPGLSAGRVRHVDTNGRYLAAKVAGSAALLVWRLEEADDSVTAHVSTEGRGGRGKPCRRMCERLGRYLVVVSNMHSM